MSSGQELPPPSLLYFVASIATQCKIALGDIENPVTGAAEPESSRVDYCVELLEILREKTEGNRTPEESAAIDNVLSQIRSRADDVFGGGGFIDDPSGGRDL